MSRVAQTGPVSPKMLRHFASLTVAITFCVAIFADGEGREAIEAQIAAREARNDLLKVQAETFGVRKIGVHDLRLRAEKRFRASNASDSSADTGSYGAPMDNAAGENDGSPAEFGGAPAGPPAGPRGGPPGQGQQRFGGPEGGPPPPGQVNRNQGARPQPPRPTPAQLEAMLAASRARSGRAGSSE